MQHFQVYGAPGRFAGWPANYGMWAWGDEVVLVFAAGYVDPAGGYHARDNRRSFETLQARSTNAGASWQVTPFPGHIPGNRGLSADEHVLPELSVAAAIAAGDAPIPPPGGIDFQDPETAIMMAKTGLKAGVVSFYYVSLDRCQSWAGPFAVPDFEQTGIAARTDYVALGQREALFFLTANKRTGVEGRVLCAHTADGGRSFRLQAWLGPEPAGFAIMPSSTLLKDGTILVATRRRSGAARKQDVLNSIDLWRSLDQGLSWQSLGTAVGDTGFGGNPPTLDLLPDGRLCLIYGLRDAPCGMRAVLSDDGGRSWSGPVTLRDGAGNHDLGYPRTVLLSGGRVATAYYWNEAADGERTIEVTLWEPALNESG